MNTYFLDCEASSLNSASYPIEVAWVDETGQGESYLIKPEPTWTDWSAQAEAIHHISRETLLRDGLPAERVARRALEVLEGKMVVSDNPSYDGHWLSVLYKLIGYPEVRLHSIHLLHGRELRRMLTLASETPETNYYHAARRLLDEGQAIISDVIDTTLAQIRQQHRALSDAMNLWLIWKAVCQAIDQRISQPAR